VHTFVSLRGSEPTGAKLALKPFQVWGIRIRLQVAHSVRDLVLFDLALDSKLRGCDLVRLKVSDLLSCSGVQRRVVIVQRKTGRPVQFEVTEQTRRSIAAWVEGKRLGLDDWLFPSRIKAGCHLTTRQYAVWSTSGLRSWGSIRPPTALTAFAALRSRCCIRRPVIYVPVSCCSVTRSWRARSAI
jgi:integrase